MPAPDEVSSHREDTALLVESVRAAGDIARKFFGGRYRQWEKSRGSPVTEADIAIDRQLRQTLLTARPDYGWLSEETDDDPARLSCRRTFVVDPIDGTHGFMRGRPHFTIVAAVVESGRPVSAAIYNPISEEIYQATAGEGALVNDALARVSSIDSLAGARLLAPRDIHADANWTEALPQSVVVETRASIAYRLALVAAGQFDGMISLSAKYEWDVAAGDLVAHEAGGLLTSPSGAKLEYNKRKPILRGVVCAGPALHKLLLDRLKPFQAERMRQS